MWLLWNYFGWLSGYFRLFGWLWLCAKSSAHFARKNKFYLAFLLSKLNLDSKYSGLSSSCRSEDLLLWFKNKLRKSALTALKLLRKNYFRTNRRVVRTFRFRFPKRIGLGLWNSLAYECKGHISMITGTWMLLVCRYSQWNRRVLALCKAKLRRGFLANWL